MIIKYDNQVLINQLIIKHIIKSSQHMEANQGPMHISNMTYRLAQLSLKHVPGSAKLLAQSFISQNKIWKNLSLPFDEVYTFMAGKIEESIMWTNELRENGTIPKDAFLSAIYLDQNDKIVLAAVSVELSQYLMRESQVKYDKLQILQKYNDQFFKTIQAGDLIQGNSVYTTYIAIDEAHLGKSILALFILDYSHHFHSKGLNTLYYRSSNIKSFVVPIQLGGYMKAIKQLEINGKKLHLFFVKYNTDPISQRIYSIQQILKKAKL